MGVPGVHLDPGDHVCAFYFGTDERDKVLVPFLQAGLQGGDKCIAVVEHPDPPEMAARLGDHAESCVASQQLVLEKAANIYLRNGAFSTTDMIAHYEELVSEAIADRYTFVRVTGEAGWVLEGPPGAEEFIDYESQLNDFAPAVPPSDPVPVRPRALRRGHDRRHLEDPQEAAARRARAREPPLPHSRRVPRHEVLSTTA